MTSIFRSVLGVSLSIAVLSSGGTISSTQKSFQLVFDSNVHVPLHNSLGIPIQSISHVVPLRERLIVVDAETNSLRVVSMDGKTLSVKTNTGANGAMLGRAARATVTSAGQILVLDVQRPQIARFRLRADQLEYAGASNLKEFANVSSLCSISERVFVLGRTLKTSSTLLQIVDDQGGVLAGFGEPFGAENASEKVQTALSAGTLTCLATERLVVAVSELSPEVRAYSADGTLKWSTILPGFAAIEINETPSGISFSYPVEGGPWDRVSGAFRAGAGVIGVQIARQSGNPQSSSSLRTLFLSTVSGTVVGSQRELGRVVGTWAGGVVTLDNSGLRILGQRGAFQ